MVSQESVPEIEAHSELHFLLQQLSALEYVLQLCPQEQMDICEVINLVCARKKVDYFHWIISFPKQLKIKLIF